MVVLSYDNIFTNKDLRLNEDVVFEFICKNRTYDYIMQVIMNFCPLAIAVGITGTFLYFGISHRVAGLR